MLPPLVLAALVELLFQLAQAYLPQVPISEELIHSVVLIILGWFGYKAVEVGVSHFVPKLMAKIRKAKLM